MGQARALTNFPRRATFVRMTETRVTTCHVILCPGFNMNATMGFLDPFRAANYLDGQGYFRWSLVSETGGPVTASNGVALETYGMRAEAVAADDLLCISTSWTPEAFGTRALLQHLRAAARTGAMLAALDTGAFLLAQANLLHGRGATVHYEHIDAFAELYPDLSVSEDLFVFDGPFATCCGGSAATDFGLAILRGLKGDAAANAVARYIFHESLRPASSSQNPGRVEPLGRTAPAKLKEIVQVMEQHLEDPLSVEALAAQVGLSTRQVARLFRDHTRASPSGYYRDIRLDRARGLVTQTEMPIAEVALASGFASPIHFSRAYRARFGLPPSRDRQEGRVPFEFRAWPMHRPAP